MFHATRGLSLTSKMDGDDLFAAYQSTNDEEVERMYNGTKLVDITRNKNDETEYSGIRPDGTMIPGKSKSSISVIKRFNRHSEAVLKASIQYIPPWYLTRN